jgi:NTP pyrophosphatase (non-canonical NTP hydrolase)
MEQYVKNALLTESKDNDKIRERLTDVKFRRMLFAKMVMASYAMEQLDAVKKFMFYGKETDELKRELAGYENSGNLPDIELFNDRMIRTIHGSIGIGTESGELIDAVLKVLTGKETELDRTNIFEESGDVDWYQAILCDEYDFTMAQIQKANNVKLAKRFNLENEMGFTDENAKSRDLNKEREILEAGANDGLTRL